MDSISRSIFKVKVVQTWKQGEIRPEGLTKCGRWESRHEGHVWVTGFIFRLWPHLPIYTRLLVNVNDSEYIKSEVTATHTHTVRFLGHEYNWCSIRTSTYIMNPAKFVDCALNQTFGPHCHSAPLSISSTLPLRFLLDKVRLEYLYYLNFSQLCRICCADNQVNYVFGRG